jgi:hypothetical protein
VYVTKYLSILYYHENVAAELDIYCVHVYMSLWSDFAISDIFILFFSAILIPLLDFVRVLFVDFIIIGCGNWKTLSIQVKMNYFIAYCNTNIRYDSGRMSSFGINADRTNADTDKCGHGQMRTRTPKG